VRTLSLATLLFIPGCAGGGQAVTWGDSLAQAEARAAEEGRPIVIVFTARGDEYCTRFESESLRHPQVTPLLAQFVCVRIEAFRSDGTDPAFRRFGFAGVPAIACLGRNGDLIDSREHGPEPDGLQQMLRGVLDRAK
jgi:hypothetical protein